MPSNNYPEPGIKLTLKQFFAKNNYPLEITLSTWTVSSDHLCLVGMLKILQLVVTVDILNFW